MKRICKKYLWGTGLCLLLQALPAQAEEAQSALSFGQWRYLYSQVQKFPLNSLGQNSELANYLDHRLRVGSSQAVTDKLSFTAEVEVFYGQVAGDFDHIAADYRDDARETLRGWDLKEMDLRQLWLRWQAPWFELRAGQMASQWGLGLLANDGKARPGRFGFPDQGDLSMRLLLATRPFVRFSGWPAKVILALGGGMVYRDENASLRDGDLGAEAIGSLIFRDEGIDAGLYLAGRFQEDEAGTELNVLAMDLYGQWDQGQGLMLAGELSVLTGSTDRVIRSDQLDGMDILSYGGAARLGWHFDCLDLLPIMEIGFASGDSNPHDATLTNFFFDPDYHVGLVLFDSILRAMTAMDAQQAADPERVGQALPGVDLLPNEGRISGVIYFNPTVSFRPLSQLQVLVGLVYALSAAPYAQSYQTFSHGGVATNAYGKVDAGRQLGWEIDFGVEWTQPIWHSLQLQAGLQTGWFFPGSAFDLPDGSRPGIVNRILAQIALGW